MNNKLAICWDQTELYRDYFENMTNLKYETYYLLYEDEKGCPSHTILVYYNNNKVYWFEPMFQNKACYYSGMIPKNYDEKNILIYQYNKPKYHINGYEMREHINNSKLIKL